MSPSVKQSRKELPESGDFAKLIAEAALEKKAEEIRILDIKDITDIADYFVICSGSSDLHVKAIVDNIEDATRTISRPWHVEGDSSFRWVLLDYIDVVVHVFDHKTRDYYGIERLWADAKITEVADPEE